MGRKYNYDDIFNFIVIYKKEHNGNSPCMAEIAESCDMPRTGTLAYVLNHLKKEGRITWTPGRKRSIEVPGGYWTYREPIKEKL